MKQILKFLVAWVLVGAVFAGAAFPITYEGHLKTDESVQFPEQGSTPANPPANKWKLYFKTDGLLYRLDEGGTETAVDTKQFTGLSDTPGSVTANQFLRGNSGGSALEFTSDVLQKSGGVMTGGLDIQGNSGASNNHYRAKGTDATYELLNNAGTQNWYFGLDDADSNSLKIGRGYGTGQGVTPSLKFDTSDNITMPAGGTFEGRDISADGTKLDGIASGAEVNPDVVSQAEAEAGTATTERIWTAQRVKQAIVALGGVGTAGFVPLGQVDGAASASIDLTSLIDTTYKIYKIFLYGVQPVTDNDVLYLRISTDNGSTWKSGASDYGWIWHGTEDTPRIAALDKVDSEIELIRDIGGGSASFDAVDSLNGEITVFHPSDTGLNAKAQWTLMLPNANNNFDQINGWGQYNATTAINAVRLLWKSGSNFNKGVAMVYGLKTP